MAVHTGEQRLFIVTRIARYYTPAAICAQFREKWPDTDCQEPDVNALNPQFVLIGPDETAVFQRERAAALEDPERLAPAINKVARCIQLAQMADEARNRNAFAIAAGLYEQIAKEQADAYAPKSTGGKAAAPASPSAEPVSEIRVTIIDPKPEPAE